MTTPPPTSRNAPASGRGSQGARIRPVWVIAAFLIVVVGALIVAGVAALLAEREEEPPACPDPTLACGGPPEQPPFEPEPSAPMLRSAGTLWESSDLGYEFQYSENWDVVSEDDSNVTLRFNIEGYRAILSFEARAASDKSPDPLLQEHLVGLQDSVLGLAPVTDPTLVFLGTPMLGYLDGVGGIHAGTLEGPNGPVEDVHVAVLAATDGEATVAMSVIVGADDRGWMLWEADRLLNTFRWSREDTP